MAFCVGCGNQMKEGSAFCGKCGAAAGTPVRAADEKIARASRIVADETLKNEHNKLVAGWAAGGTFLTLIINVILLAIGFNIGGKAGGTFLVLAGLAATVLFVASLIPSKSAIFDVSRQKVIDPVTGAPLKMLWWFRWMVAMIALWTFVGSTDLFSPPQSAPLEAGAAPSVASMPPDSPDAGSNTGYAAVDEAPQNTPAEDAEGLRAFCTVVFEAGEYSPSNTEQTLKKVLEADNLVASTLHEPLARANIVVTRVSSGFATSRYGPADCEPTN